MSNIASSCKLVESIMLGFNSPLLGHHCWESNLNLIQKCHFEYILNITRSFSLKSKLVDKVVTIGSPTKTANIQLYGICVTLNKNI